MLLFNTNHEKRRSLPQTPHSAGSLRHWVRPFMKREGGWSIRKHMSISAINKISFQDHMIVYIYVVTRQACVWEIVRTIYAVHP